MKKNVASGLVMALFALAPLGFAQEGTTPPAPAASEMPRPAKEWWKQAEVGLTATYQMQQMGQNFDMVMQVEELTETSITFSVGMFMGETPAMPKQSQTVEFSQFDPTDEMPEGAEIKKVGDESVEAAGRTFKCEVYEMSADNGGMPMKVKMWFSQEILPVFNGGNVKMEIEMSGPQGGAMKATMMLKELAKKPVEPAPKAAPEGEGEGEGQEGMGGEDGGK